MKTFGVLFRDRDGHGHVAVVAYRESMSELEAQLSIIAGSLQVVVELGDSLDIADVIIFHVGEDDDVQHVYGFTVGSSKGPAVTAADSRSVLLAVRRERRKKSQ